MVDFADLIEAFDSIEAAKAGNLEPMIARLERLTPSEAEWLAAELRGEHKAKRGRKKLRQTKGDHLPIKGRFTDNSDIDLAAWDAFNFIVRAEGKGEAEAKREIADILGETTKNVSHRLNRLRAHLATGKTRAAYRSSAESETIRAAELIAEAFARIGYASDPSLQFPFLLALGRK
jgi:hypothetical protein